MSSSQISPYLQRLLDLYDEKRKRFQWAFSVLLFGTIAFFFIVFFPYLTLLGNRAACLARQIQCTQLEASILDERFTEVTTSWGNIPISTAEIVVLFPLLIAASTAAVSTQLIGLMRLRSAIQSQVRELGSAVDVTLIAPILLDARRSPMDWMAGGATFILPVLISLFSINMIYVRIEALRNALPYIQSLVFYHQLYLASGVILFITVLRVSCEFLKTMRA